MNAQMYRRVTARRRIAYHEAGHAVLSAALNDSPHQVSIRAVGRSLGRARYRMEGRAEWLVQVYLAGFAAEEILTGRRAKLDFELGCVAAAATDPSLASLADDLEGCDQDLAVKAVLSMGCIEEVAAVRSEVDRFLGVAKDSLIAVWPAVEGVAEALLKHTDLDYQGFSQAVGGHDIYAPVFAVQEANGLLRR